MISKSFAQTNNEENRENNKSFQDFYYIQMLVELERTRDSDENCDNDLRPDPDPRDEGENSIRAEEEGTGGDCTINP